MQQPAAIQACTDALCSTHLLPQLCRRWTAVAAQVLGDAPAREPCKPNQHHAATASKPQPAASPQTHHVETGLGCRPQQQDRACLGSTHSMLRHQWHCSAWSSKASFGWHTSAALQGQQMQRCAYSSGRLATTKTPSSEQGSEDEELALLASELLTSDERGNLTPAAIVKELDKFIIGQDEAKRAVAVALRNRWRRSKLPELAADEVMPKNILMVGPTGVGKTEIARRLAKLADAPFVKVEATKYTELGYVGRDVEDIIKDLVEAAQSLVRQRLQRKAAQATADRVERIILNALAGDHAEPHMRATLAELYRQGGLDENTISLELPNADNPNRRITFEHGNVIVYEAGSRSSSASNKQSVKVREARQKLEEAEVERMMSSEQVTREAIRAAEQDGIVFIDEIDKVVESSGRMHTTAGSVSGSGVQRDLLPIIEGSTVPTKYGNVNTDHILFICAGAFHSSKPQDMMAELQGRLPIRVALTGLTAKDFERILLEPEHSMLMQQQALLATEGVELVFTDTAVKTIAQVAEEVNRMLDNIGARRLHTVLERILADISFTAPEKAAEAQRQGHASYQYIVDEHHVRSVMKELLGKKDLSRYVL